MDANLDELIRLGLAEDLGPGGSLGDITTVATVDSDKRARATITQKAPGVIYGLDIAIAVLRELDHGVEVLERAREGEWRDGGAVEGVPEQERLTSGAVVLVVEGSARALLTGERTALNFLAHLSGIATATARVVRSLADFESHATILDTRKTTPGLRSLEKAAVAAGGGTNHRTGLFDAILIKENHIALAGGITRAVVKARTAYPDMSVEVEVRDPNEIDEALAAGAQRLLLDNMTPAEIKAAVAQVGGRAELEASGGVTEETILVYATIIGLDYVSIGALTHSAPVLDLSMALEAL